MRCFSRSKSLHGGQLLFHHRRRFGTALIERDLPLQVGVRPFELTDSQPAGLALADQLTVGRLGPSARRGQTRTPDRSRSAGAGGGELLLQAHAGYARYTSNRWRQLALQRDVRPLAPARFRRASPATARRSRLALVRPSRLALDHRHGLLFAAHRDHVPSRSWQRPERLQVRLGLLRQLAVCDSFARRRRCLQLSARRDWLAFSSAE